MVDLDQTVPKLDICSEPVLFAILSAFLDTSAAYLAPYKALFF